MTALAQPGTWHTRLLAAPAPRRRRLPRDVVGALAGAAIAAGGWLAVVAGPGKPVAAHLGPAVSWLVTLVAVGGTSVFLGVSVLVCALAGRWSLLSRLIIAAGVAAVGCVAVAHGLGTGQQSAPPLVAATFAGAMLVIRSLAVPVRAWSWAVVFAGTGALVVSDGLVPAGALAAAGLGALLGAVVQLAFGTPYGGVAQVNVVDLVSQLGVTAHDINPAPHPPTWGVTRFTALDGEGHPLDIDLYGRDAPEGQLLSRLWRFVWIRRSTLDLRLRRADHAGHAAGLMLWARALGVAAPTVVAARRTEPAGDVVLVTRPPAGRPLSGMAPGTVDDEDICAAWRSLQRLDAAGIAVNAVRADTLIIGAGHQVAFTEFAAGEAMAPPEARLSDAASLLAATARVAGPQRAVAIAAGVIGRDRVIELLPLIQPRAMPTHPDGQAPPHLKKELAALRREAAAYLSIDPVEPVPLVRVRLSQLLMLAATFFGLWLLVQQFVGFSEITDVLAGASWGWVAATLLITQTTAVTEAVAMSGAVPAPLPLGPLALLRMAMWFTGLLGGTAARTATVVRFYQKRGLAPIVAVSSGLIYSVGGFCVQVIFSVTALVFAGDEFHFKPAGSAGSGAEVLQLVLYAIVAAGLIGGIAFLVPKVRRLAAARLQPRLAPAWANLRNLFNNPGQLARLFTGAALTQLLLATGLGFALHAVGASASFGALIIVCTLTSLLGGIAPVPGGMGVMEASYIALLTLLGISEDLAIAATLLYRLCTTYLPPIWGWGALVWLRRHDEL
jgi:glycosyltransferase 2 family protein